MQNATFPAFGLSWFAFNLIQIEGKPLQSVLPSTLCTLHPRTRLQEQSRPQGAG